MPPEPVPANPGWDEDLAWLDRDPERETWLDRAREHDDPPGDEEFEDFEPLTPDELAEIREAATDELLAVEAATTGRRGPGQPGSARVFPGESSSPAAAFGPGMPLDVLPGCAGLALSADATGVGDRFAGVSEGELIGVVCAWDRVEAHAAARKLAAIAELARRNPKPEDAEFTADELGNALAESRTRAYALLGTADHLDTHLPGTRAALRDGTVSMSKAQIIANATGLLEPAEARAAEAKVLDRAARLTPGALRAAIARAVIEVAPEKAKERRETAAKFARVERWREDSGNAALAGRELPRDGPPDGYGTWRLHTPGNGPDLLVTLDPLTTRDCDHRFESRGYDPGVKLKHLSQIRHATCTSPICRRPASQCDFEHNTPYEAGGRTCLCNGGPPCKR